MPSFEHHPASFESVNGTNFRDDETTLYRELAAFHGSINSGSGAGTFSPSQKVVEDFFNGVRRYEENLTYSPRMSQGATVYGANMAMGHSHNNEEGYSTSAYDNTAAMNSNFASGQPTAFENLQANIALPAQTSNWTTEDYAASPTYDISAAAAVMHTPPTQSNSNAADNAIYRPTTHPPSSTNDYLGFFAEPADIPAPLYPPELTPTDAYDSTAYHQPESIYTAGLVLAGADTSAVYPTPAPIYSRSTFNAPAHHASYCQPAHSDFTAGADALYIQPQSIQPSLSYAQLDIGYGVDPRQLHVSSSSIRDPETAHEAPLSCAVRRTPSLGYSSGSSPTSTSLMTPTGPVSSSASALGKSKALDAGFDGDHHDHRDHGGATQASAQPRPRAVKRPRMAKQPARVANTVDPHVGITNKTDAAALTRTKVNSKASGRGARTPANPAFEDIPGAGAGPSKALPKKRSRAKKQKALPKQDFVPLWEQDLTLQQRKETAKKMSREELIANMTEKADAIAPEEGDEDGKRSMCKWPQCGGSAKRNADTARHIGWKHLDRKVFCPLCEKGFRGQTEVNRHIGGAQCKPENKQKAKVEVESRAAIV